MGREVPQIDMEGLKEDIKGVVKEHDIKEVILQIPEGLISQVQEIVSELKNEEVEVVIHGDSTYGACDLPVWQAKLLGIKHIIHLGHTKFYDVKDGGVEVHYIPIHKRVSESWLKEGVKKVVKEMEKHKISLVGIVSTAQYTHILQKVKEELEKMGKKCRIYKSPLQQYAGQILGCEVTAAKAIENEVEGVLYIGEGEFHPIGLIKEIDKPIIKWSIDTGEVSTIPKEIKERIIKRDIVRVSELKDAKKIIMLVPTKEGQYCRFSKGWRGIKKRLEEEGKEVYVIEAYHISPSILEGYEYDVILNLACPRLEDDKVFPKPIISLSTLVKYWDGF